MKNNFIGKNAGLLIIDVQKGFDDPKWGKRNNLNAEKNIARLLEFWREKNLPVLHVQHMSTFPNSPLRPEQEGNQIKSELKPADGEPLFQKTVNSAFIGTELEDYLRENEIDTLVVTGLTTNHCVSTSTRMAGNFGFDTYLVEDAVACFEITDSRGNHFSAEEVQAISIANLDKEFATIVSTADILD